MRPITAQSFSKLILELHDTSDDGTAATERFELTADGTGAHVTCADELAAPGSTEPMRTDARYLGFLTGRRIVDMLVQLEKSGIYEDDGTEETSTVHGDRRSVSLHVCDGETTHTLCQGATPASGCIQAVLQDIRKVISIAQERSLAMAG